jgi:cephalosporin hydroxylase
MSGKHFPNIEGSMASVGFDSYLADMTEDVRELADRFLELYYNARQKNLTWGNTRWMGVKTLRCPLDLWLYQEIIFDTKPDLIVETGTAEGGGALFLASMCDLVQHGQVISIDIQHRPNLSSHPRLTYLTGSSTARETVEKVKGRAAQGQTLVILDSDHSRAHVLAELQAYAPLVRKNGYLIVEDTIVNGHPLRPEFGPGPMEAVEEFLGETPDWIIDRTKEKFLLSFNRNGYLKRVR